MNQNPFVSVCSVYSGNTGNVMTWMYEVQLVIFIEFGLVYEELEGFFPFQNMYIEEVHIDLFSKILPRALM